ncbi:MAG TPA: acyl-CoA dehydratase activase [Terriglobales bacterium]|jgi:predicted CoA-substrate-specific enzyme activase|nr:acyl-CoA dehydratase activase [Terriglobales bacterium]
MGVCLGLDIGAVSLKLAAIGSETDGDLLASLPAHNGSFFLTQASTGSPRAGQLIVLSAYRRIQGSPVQATFELLKLFCEHIPEDRIEGLRVTGSGSQLIAKILDTPAENEFRAVARGVRTFYPEVRTVFEMGGESSKYLRLERSNDSRHLGIIDYQSSGDCAAGTGSFIDQQASRLLYAVEQVGAAACAAACAARVAGRCSVFAKTDMIHAQQKGYSTDQILRGLCEAVARNFKSSIVRGRPVIPPVLFIGAVALNEGVRRALGDAFKLQDSEFVVPPLHCWLGALGAALFAAEEPRKQALRGIDALQQHASIKQTFAANDRLTMQDVILLRDRVQHPPPPAAGTRIEAYLGIDIGSVSTNLVVIDAAGNLLKEIYVPTSGRPIEVVSAGLQEICSELGDVLDIRGVGTTGSGRELIGELVGADTVNDEITAHKTGAMEVCRQLGMKPVDTIFEIGGQDSKFIRIDHGVVVDFAMNEACAAGTGSFLEEQAEKLGISIKEEFAKLSLASRHPARLGERCTVFMERDVTSLLLKGAAVGDLCAGLAYSVAINYLNRVVRGRKIGDVIYFQGGTAYNHAVAAAFSQILGKPIIVPPHNGVIGAIGMALIARERMQGTEKPSQFRGFDLSRTSFTTRDFVCRACSNYCDMKEFVIAGQKSYWGDKCSDKFRKRARTEREPVIEDLMELYDQLLMAPLKSTNSGTATVGIPRTMFFYDRFPFWCTYFQELGFEVVVSPSTDGRIAGMGDELAVAQPCFPVQVAHGHVQALLDMGVDHVLLPNIVDSETPNPQVQSKMCPWNQSLPYVVRVAPQLQKAFAKFLAPTVHFRYGRKQVDEELARLARTLGRNGRANNRAVGAAYEAQAKFREALLEAGKSTLKRLRATAEPAVVLVGRAYNIYDRNVNCDIPRKLRALYGVNVVPLHFLPLDEEDISAVNSNMYWNSGRQMLAAASITRRYPDLHWIHISNFKCGPDSYIKAFLSEASGKPGLSLQFDGHSNDAGYITRCEAYLDSKGFLRCASLPISA